MKAFDFKIGFSCNNWCVHCVIGDRAEWVPDLKTDDVKKTLKEKADEGYESVGFTGGEVSIRRDLEELFRYAKELGFYVAVQTNATGFADPERAARIAKYCDQALIAIHSVDKDIHNLIVGDKRTGANTMFDRTMQGFYNMVEQGVYVQTQTVLSKLNIETAYDTYAHIQSIAPGIKMNMTYPHPMGSAYTNHEAVLFQYSDAKDIFHKILRDFGEHISVEAIPYCYLYPYQDKVWHNVDAETMTGQRDAGVDPAHAIMHDQEFDLFSEDGFTENYAINDLVTKVKGPRCTECVFYDRCPGVWQEYYEFFKDSFDLYPITADQYQPQANELDSCSVILYTEGGCDAQCVFCGGGINESQTDKDLYLDAIRQVNEHAKHGIHRDIEISGEGAANPYVVDLVKYIVSMGFDKDIQLSTNGHALANEDLVRQLKEAGLSRCRIPLYGVSAETHGAIIKSRTVSAERMFEDTLRGIANCAKNGIRVCGHTIIHQYNKNELGAIIDLYYAITNRFMYEMTISQAGITHLTEEFVGDWYLPTKDAGPYLRKVLDDPYFDEINLHVNWFPFCAIGRYDDRVQAYFHAPNVLPDTIVEGNESEEILGVPHYILRERIDECPKCILANECSGMLRNDKRMFGSGDLKAIQKC